MQRMQLTVGQRTFIVRKYYETRSFLAVKEAFLQQFPERNPPSTSTIQRNVEKYEREGTSLNLNKKRSGRRRTTRSQENIEQVRLFIAAQPQGVSCRRNPIGISKTAFNEITKHDLKWHPFKIHLVQKLQAGDPARRLRYCQWFSNQAHNIRFMSNIVIGDEAAFHLCGKVSTQNVRCYAPKGEAPHQFKFEKHSSRKKLHVWMGLCGNGEVIGPFFFNQNVNGRTYREMLENFAFPGVARAFVIYDQQVFRNIWWFQDGAPAHGSLEIRDLLRRKFEDRVVALHHEHEWPPRSPDLTPLDFFLWGYLKQKVFATPPENLPELRRRIVEEVNILRDNGVMVRRSFAAMSNRANLCIERNGSHIECQ